MAKKPDITTIASGYYSRVKLNENFENLQNGFDNTLSLDGSTPNAMLADLDFNNNNAINIASLDAQTITLGGSATDLSDIQALTGIGQDIQTLADIEDGTEATDAIQTAASVSSEISVVSGVSSDVTTVAAIDADVSTVAAVSSDVSTVASNITDVTNFADVYLGPAALDPATRNDGSPLQEGDLYFNTTSDEMRTYEGSSWVAAFVSLSDALIDSNNLSDVADPAAALSNLGLTASASELNTLDGVTVSTTEINRLDGVTSNLQTQLDDKISGVTAGTGLSGGGSSGSVTLNGVTQTTAAWEAGTSTTEGIVSPAKVKAAIESNAGGGGLVPLTTATASNDATIEFTAFDSSLYDSYVFVFGGIIGASDAGLRMRCSDDGGTSYASGSSYAWEILGQRAGASTSGSDQVDTEIHLTQGTVDSADTFFGVSGCVEMFDVSGGSNGSCMVVTQLTYSENGTGYDLQVDLGSGFFATSSSETNGVQFFLTSGNIASGTITMYGRKKV